MKKYIPSLTAILMLVYSLNVMAQQTRSLWVNGAAGLNSSLILNQSAYGNQEMAYSPTAGLTGGLGVNYFINKVWGLSGSTLISCLGQKYSGVQAGADAKRQVKLTYIEVPLMLMRQIHDLEYPTWISAGPDIMILLNAKQEYSREGGSELPNPAAMAAGDVTDRFRPLDLALNVSLNRMIELNYSRKVMFLFSINSSLGLLDINRADWHLENTHNIYASSHNFYIGAKFGLMFKVKKYGYSHW